MYLVQLEDLTVDQAADSRHVDIDVGPVSRQAAARLGIIDWINIGYREAASTPTSSSSMP